MNSASRPTVAWSFSVLEMFENCPRKYWAVKIAKKVSDINKWNAKGDSEHDHFNHYLKKGLALPENIRGYQPLLDKVKNAPGELYSEYQMTLDQNFVPCGFKDWDRAWVRGATDALVVNGPKAFYFDWKSGKFRPKDDQIELSSLLIFKHFPQVQQVNGGLVFYRYNKAHPHIVRREDEPRLWNSFIARVRELEMAVKSNHFPPTPNPLCAYCPYADCQYNTNKELPPR